MTVDGGETSMQLKQADGGPCQEIPPTTFLTLLEWKNQFPDHYSLGSVGGTNSAKRVYAIQALEEFLVPCATLSSGRRRASRVPL